MSKSKMLAAKAFIDQKNYAEARQVLKTVNHPTAREWEAKLDRIAPPKPKTARWKLYALVAGLLILGAFLVWNVFDQQRIANNIAALKAENAAESLQADREYCLIQYNDNPAGYDQCMKNLGH